MSKPKATFEIVLEGVDPEDVPAEQLGKILSAVQQLAKVPISLIGVKKVKAKAGKRRVTG